MIKKSFVGSSLIVGLCLLCFFGCTSGEKKAEGEAEEAGVVAEAGEGSDEGADNLGEEGLDGEQGDVAAEDGAVDGGGDGGEVGEDDLTADLGEEDLGGDDLGTEDLGEGKSGESLNADSNAPTTNDSGTEDPSSIAEGTTPPPAAGSTGEELAPQELGSTVADSEAIDEAPKFIPVKKIKDVPFTKDGVLLNAVYIARPDDTVKSASEKIFGEDRSESLLSLNPHLKRGFKPGDKMYYNSPQRPADNARLLTFYEDLGLPAGTYVSKPGDNIRKVSSTLLGFPEAWKEVWATNFSVDSKGELPENTELKYWANSDVGGATTPSPTQPEPVSPAPTLADNNPPVPPPLPEPALPPTGEAEIAPPPSAEAGAGAIGSVEPPPPPPPPMAEPPPAPPARVKADAPSSDPDQTMILGTIAVVLIGGIALFILNRKRRKSSLDFNTSTQIDHTHIR